jgi:hypothetical protein
LGFPLPQAGDRFSKGEAEVTREEARRLLSGYATGSLTELEQQLLFDAALEDQELFDELAAEQTVKELVELPGARRRLLEALGPEKKAVVWWPWAVGAAAAMLGVAVWLSRPAAQPGEMAQPVEMARVEVPAAAPFVLEEKAALEENKLEVPATPSAPKISVPTPRFRDEALPVPAELEARAQQQLPVLQPTAPPPPAAAPAKTALLAERSVALLRTETAAAEPSTNALKQLPILGLAGAAKGKALPAPPKLAPLTVTAEASLLSSAPTGGSLSYEVRNTGILRMTPTRTGMLEVTFDGRALFPERSVAAGVTIDVSIPLEAKQLRIDYALEANAPEAAARTGEIEGTLTLPGGAGRAVVVIPAQR